MVYILERNMEGQERLAYGLSKVYGLGYSRSLRILKKFGISELCRVSEVDTQTLRGMGREINRLYKINLELQRDNLYFIKKLKENKSYRGMRHIYSLPARGQRT